MNRVEQAICRIREKRPQAESFVTLGVGCVVRHEILAASLGWKCANLLVTSAHVLTPQQLVSNNIVAEFLVFDKKGYEVFELKPAAEFCQIVQGRVLESEHASSDNNKNEQLTIISVEPLDKRGFLKRMVKRSSLQTSRPIDCFDFLSYQSEIEDGIFCNVIREYGSHCQEFESRTYKFKFDAFRNVYLLEDFLKRDVELEEQSFPSDQVLAGGIIFSKQGLYLGCLGLNAGHIVPAFVPDKIIQKEQAESEEKLEQKASCEAEGQNATSKQVPAIDENENRDLQKTDLTLAAHHMEKQDDKVTNDNTTQETQQGTSQNVELVNKGIEENEGASQHDPCAELQTEEKLVGNEVKNEVSNDDNTKNSADLESATPVDESNSMDTSRQNEEATSAIESGENAIANDSDVIVENDQKEETISEREENNVEIENSEMTPDEKEKENLENTGDENTEAPTKQIEDELENVDIEKEEGKIENTDIEILNKLEDEGHDVPITQSGVISDIPQVNTNIDHGATSTDNAETIDDNVPMETNTETGTSEEENVTIEDLPEEATSNVTELESEESKEEMEVNSMEIKSTAIETETNEEVEMEETCKESNISEVETQKNEEEVLLSDDVPTDVIETSTIETPKIEDDLNVDEVGQTASVGSSSQQASSEENVDSDILSDARKEDVEVISQEQTSKEEDNDVTEKTEDEKDNTEEQKTEEIADQPNNTEEVPPQVINETSELASDQDEVNQQVTMSTSPHDKQDDIQTDTNKELIKQDKPVIPEIGEPLEPDDLLSTKITDNPKALDDLSNLLDTEYQYGGVSSWHDLAELLAIPKEAYDHCLAFSKPSPTEDLMVFVSNTKPQFAIIDLKDSLRSMGRADAVRVIDRYIARGIISDGTVIQGVIEQENIDLLGELALKLDRGNNQNWKVLARQLDVPSRIFRNFGSHQKQNSALLMLKYLPIFDPDLVVDSFKEACKATGLDDLVKLLETSGVPGEDTIMDILDDTDFIDELTDLLNEEEENIPNWKKVAKSLKIPEEKFSIFESSSMNSPTKMLLQSIAQCEPDITVDELILALVAMKRHDVIDMLGRHFRNSDIRSILEENNCLPPQPEPAPEEEQEEDSSD